MTQQPGVETTVDTMCCRAILGRCTRATVDKAMDLAGGGSFLRKNALERLFRDVQGVRYHPLQEKPQNVQAGRFAFGLPLDDQQKGCGLSEKPSSRWQPLAALGTKDRLGHGKFLATTTSCLIWGSDL